ncbi:MAG: sigma-70 family RNA polymerase sigma factor [Candidatus Eisenbacteria bacterium]|nr:sigma-70 family RNA polymerase sigma factor [Candidatus Eisenbacteria bacterium]
MPTGGSNRDVTLLLKALTAGREGAEEALLPLIYDELRALAHHFMANERAGHTLQTTALVHEAYLRLCGSAPQDWANKSHYMRVAARAMRRVLIDHARRKHAQKRGGRARPTELEPEMAIQLDDTVDLLALDRALTKLSSLDPRMGQVVELRYFCGLTIEETADVLGASPRTVKTDWTMARAWLKQELS